MSNKSGAVKISRTISETRTAVAAAKYKGHKVGLVPTMGYLHQGHQSLIDLCRKHADFVVVSIFVNPTQFGPAEDFASYPRDFARDKELVESRGAQLIFAPDPLEMYPQSPLIRFAIDKLGDHLCGASRPGHFAGVVQVVTKLFQIVQPDVAVFGQKDLQQLLIIKRLVSEYDFPLTIIAGETLREPDGLAMSSRNSYLSAAERVQARVLSESLSLARGLVENGERDASLIKDQMKQHIKKRVPSAIVDYIEVISLDMIEPVARCEGRFAIALAAYIGKTRLIDNIVLELRGQDVKEIKALD